MRIAYITGDIIANGHFTLMYDLLANYPKKPGDKHRIYLVAPNWDNGLVKQLKERDIDIRSCFEEFQSNREAWLETIRKDTEDCDVIISGNITNLDDVLSEEIDIPIVSLSICEEGYKDPNTGVGSIHKKRFNLAAVSHTAKNVFPVRTHDKVNVIYSGLDSRRLAVTVNRNEVRETWFPTDHQERKLILFVGTNNRDKGFGTLVDSLEYLPQEYAVIAPSTTTRLGIPDHLSPRVFISPPVFHVGNLYEACDMFVLPTKQEGLSMALLEAWYMNMPTVTTNHNTLKELQKRSPKTDFGEIVPLEELCPERLAESILKAKKSPSANEYVLKNHTSTHMITRWQDYLTETLGIKP